MTISKQGMLVLHAIALTILLILTMSWKAPIQQNRPGVDPAYSGDSNLTSLQLWQFGT
jgi:hypothetical protein